MTDRSKVRIIVHWWRRGESNLFEALRRKGFAFLYYTYTTYNALYKNVRFCMAEKSGLKNRLFDYSISALFPFALTACPSGSAAAIPELRRLPAAFRASLRISIIGIVSVCFNGMSARIGGCHSGIEKVACRLQSVIPVQHYRHCFRLL